MAIRLVTADSGGWQSWGETILAAEVSRATTLAHDPSVVAIVGPGGSREALQVAPIYRDAGVMQLVPTATSRLLAPLGEWTLTLVPNDSIQGEFLGAYAADSLGARRAAIFYVPDEYGVGLASGTVAALERRGTKVLLRLPIAIGADCRSAGGQESYAALAAQLARRGVPESAIIAARQLESGCLVRALRDRWPDLAILAGDGTLVDPGFIERAAGRADGMCVVAFWHPRAANEASLEFDRRFAERVGRPVRHSDAVFRDAVMLAAAAIREGGPSRASVRRYLRGLGEDRPPFEGLTGRIAFTPGFERPLIMTQVRGGQVVPVGPR